MTTNLAYWEQRLQQNWGLQGVGHISYGAAYNGWLYKVRRHVFMRELRSLPVQFEEANVLDVGSGTGFWIDVWNEIGIRSITGSDLTRTAVERLQAAYPQWKIVQMDISAALEHNQLDSYDVISAFDVLFHVVADDAFASALKNISRLLKPDGYFIFSDNFLHGRGRKAFHQSNRTLEDISSALRDAGLRIVRRVPMFVLMNTPIDTQREWLLLLWRALMFPVHLLPLLGHIYGAGLYPLELCATRFFKESPTTEMMICKKVNS